MEMLNETFEQGELPYTMRKALLALLYKKGDDTLLKNYRPISLTNYDYKILCFVLANRLQKVLHNIILVLPHSTSGLPSKRKYCDKKLTIFVLY